MIELTSQVPLQVGLGHESRSALVGRGHVREAELCRLRRRQPHVAHRRPRTWHAGRRAGHAGHTGHAGHGRGDCVGAPVTVHYDEGARIVE